MAQSASPSPTEATEILSPRMRIVAVICAVAFFAASIVLPIFTWVFGHDTVGLGVWAAVAIVCMVAAQCGRNLLRAARSGIGPQWTDRNSL